MSTPSAMPAPESPSASRKAALLTLLGDEDEGVYQAVRERLIAGGPAVIEWLRPYLLSDDPLLRRRAHDIIDHFGRDAADTDFLAFCVRPGELDLETGVWLLARTEYPQLNEEAYTAQLDSYAGELRERLDRQAGGEVILAAVQEYVFGALGFRGDEEHYYDPQNSYLNRVIDRRRGNPISLCVLYLLLGRRLRLPLTGIGLPGHFLCRYQSAAVEYYIDVFNGGRLWTKANCLQYLVRNQYQIRPDLLAPQTSRGILGRMCRNLVNTYEGSHRPETARCQAYLAALGF